MLDTLSYLLWFIGVILAILITTFHTTRPNDVLKRGVSALPFMWFLAALVLHLLQI